MQVTVDYMLGDALLHSHVVGDITDLSSTLALYLPLAGGTMSGNIAFSGTQTVDGVDISAHAADSSAHHAPVTLGTNTATALSLSGQQLSIGDVFLQNSGDISTGTLQIGTSPATYLYTTGVIDAGLRLTLATNPGISREGVGGVVSNIWVGVPKPSGLTTGYQNTFVAPDSGATTAGKSLTSGYKNFGLGAGSLYNLGTGFSNISIGIESSASITSGGGNIGIGPQVFYGANPNNATAIGQFAAYNLLTGYGVYIGDRASYSQQYGFHNTSVGDYSLYSNNAGSDNASFGWYSGYHITGNRCLTLGAFAGNNAAFSGIDDQLIIANSTTATPLIYGIFASATAHIKINGGLKHAVAIKSGNYTLTSADYVVVFTATATATLPAATGTGQTYRIICRAGSLTIDANGSETIKGDLTQVLTAGEDLIISDTASGIWE